MESQLVLMFLFTFPNSPRKAETKTEESLGSIHCVGFWLGFGPNLDS